MNGEKLYTDHYDKVDAAVRERYENVKASVPEVVKHSVQQSGRKR